MEDTSYVEAWAWVLKHASIINGITVKLCGTSGLDIEDLRQFTIERCVKNYHLYDSKHKPSTWIWYQVLASKKQMMKHHIRMNSNISIDDSEASFKPLTTKPNQEAIVTLSELRSLSRGDEWEAALAKGMGFEGEQLGKMLQCAPYSARRKAQRLIERYIRS